MIKETKRDEVKCDKNNIRDHNGSEIESDSEEEIFQDRKEFCIAEIIQVKDKKKQPAQRIKNDKQYYSLNKQQQIAFGILHTGESNKWR